MLSPFVDFVSCRKLEFVLTRLDSVGKAGCRGCADRNPKAGFHHDLENCPFQPPLLYPGKDISLFSIHLKWQTPILILYLRVQILLLLMIIIFYPLSILAYFLEKITGSL